MPHPLAVHLVVEAGVVLGGVHQPHGPAHDPGEKFLLHDVVLAAQLMHRVQESFQPVGRIKQRRLVHIVPEALNAAVGQHLVAVAEPRPHFRPQKVCEVSFAGPHGCHEGRAVFFFAEITLFQPFGAGGLLGVDTHTCINDGHQPDALGFQLGSQRSQIRKALFVDGEVGVILHVVDVHADHIQRQIVLFVLACHLPHILGGLVAPAALLQAEGPFGRDVTAADQLAELVGNVVQVCASEDVKLIVRLLCGKAQGVVHRVTDVVVHFAREIHEDAKQIAAGAAVNQQKIVGTIVRDFVLTVVGFIGVVGDIVPTALVDAAGHLAQTVHDGIRSHRIHPAVCVSREERNGIGRNRNILHNAVGADGRTKTKMLDHRGNLHRQIDRNRRPRFSG